MPSTQPLETPRRVLEYLRHVGAPYELSSHNVVCFVLRAGERCFRYFAYYEGADRVHFVSVCVGAVRPEQRAAVLDALNEQNAKLSFGNWRIDESSGHVAHRFVLYRDPSDPQHRSPSDDAFEAGITAMTVSYAELVPAFARLGLTIGLPLPTR